MNKLYDNTFWLHVLIGSALIILFVYFFYFGKGAKKSSWETTELARCRQIVATIVAVIQEAESEAELDQYQNEAEQFFVDNYEFLGFDRSNKFYQEMTAAGIKRRKELKQTA